jgi:hypothetical protein
MRGTFGLRVLIASVAIIQPPAALADCVGAVGINSSYVVLYRDTTSSHDYKIARCNANDHANDTWAVLDTCVKDANNRLDEDVVITGSGQADLIEINSGAAVQFDCGSATLSTYTWPEDGGDRKITVLAGAGDDIITARTDEFAAPITNPVVFSGGSGDDCLGTGDGAQQNDYDFFFGGEGNDKIGDSIGSHDTFIGDSCTELYPGQYACSDSGGNDKIRTPTNFDVLICGPGDDESWPEYGANGCEEENSSATCGSWTPPF